MFKNKHKNIILISVDSLRFDSLSMYTQNHKLMSGRKVKPITSSIDWFAKHGIFYNNCITTAPYTTTAHASVLTGQWPKNHGLQVFFMNAIKSKTAFEIFSSKGFMTLLFTDFPLILGPHLGFTRGVDHYLTKHENQVIDIIQENKEKNFFGLFHFAGAHYPYGFTRDIREHEKEMTDVIEHLYNKYNIDLLDEMTPTYKIRHRDEHEELLYQHYRHILHQMHKRKLWAELLDLYTLGLNKFMNERLDPFLKKLRDLGLTENSLFVIFGDHGEEYDKESRGHYTSLAEPIVRVPLIISGPEIEMNTQTTKQVRLIDILPTIMNWRGYRNLCKNTDGVSLLSQELVPANLKGYTQSWLSSSNEMINYMNYTLKNDKFPENPFKNFLYKESLCWNGFRYENTFSPDKKSVKKHFTTLECFEKNMNKSSQQKIYEEELASFNI